MFKMKKSNRRTPLYDGIILLSLGLFVTALGIALLIISIKDSISNDNSKLVAQIIVSLVVVGLGIIPIVFSGKKIYLRIRQSKTQKTGKETTAKITDYRTTGGRTVGGAGEGRMLPIRYAFILSYNDGVTDKTFMTDFIYDINEYEYLMKLNKVKINFNGDFAIISEPFPKDIYKVDSRYGIDSKFFKQKKIKIMFSLWAILFVAALSFLIASIILENETAILASIILLPNMNVPFMVALAIYLVKWYTKK